MNIIYNLPHGSSVPEADFITVQGGSVVIVNVTPTDDSYRYRALMQFEEIVLKFSLPCFVDFPTGAKLSFQGKEYTLQTPPDFKEHGERQWEYTLTFRDFNSLLQTYKMRNSVDRRLKFSMCAKPREFVAEIVRNLNQRHNGRWKIGCDCIDADEKTVEFNHVYISEALASIATAFETEWHIADDGTITLGKIEYDKNEPLGMSYGRGNGFVPGVGRSTESGEMPVTRLYVQGGTRNIDRSKYGGREPLLEPDELPGESPWKNYFHFDPSSAELRLPVSETIGYDGTHFDDEDEFDSDKARWYHTDVDGYYVEADDPAAYGREDSFDGSEIYPMREGHVSSVEKILNPKGEAGADDEFFYDIIDRDIPDDLDYNEYVIDGETATIVFQSGMLAGKEFEFKYIHEDRKFEIVPTEVDGINMPSDVTLEIIDDEQFGGWIPQEGDKYAVFGVMLPTRYIVDAQRRLLKESVKKLYEKERQKFTFIGEMQGTWARQNWEQIQRYMRPGSHVLFTDSKFAPDGEVVRITAIKDYINKPHAPIIELSNAEVSAQTVSSQLESISNTEVKVEDTERRFQRLTRRRWQDAKDTIEALGGNLKEYFADYSEQINPLSIETMAMLVGDERLQFRYIKSKSDERIDTNAVFVYNNETGKLQCPSTVIEHLTLGVPITTQNNSTLDVNLNKWSISSTELTPENADDRYYLFAQCKVGVMTGIEAQWILTTAPLAFKTQRSGSLTAYYNLLAGVLNAEIDGVRSFVTMNGFTEILPGRITTDKIVSTDGQTYFDLAHSEIGGNIVFVSPDNTSETLIQGGLIKSKFLDVQDLTAGAIRTKGIAHTEVCEDKQEYYDSDGRLRLKVHADSVDYSGNGSTSTIRLPTKTYTQRQDKSVYLDLSSSQYAGGERLLRFSNADAAGGTSQVDVFNIYLHRTQPTGIASMGDPTPWVRFTFYLRKADNTDDVVLYSETMQIPPIAMDVASATDTLIFSIPAIDYVFNGGAFYISVKIEINSLYNVQWNGSSYDMNANLASTRYWSEFGNDGGVIRNSATRYAIVCNSGTILRSNDYELKVDDNGIWVKTPTSGGYERLR